MAAFEPLQQQQGAAACSSSCPHRVTQWQHADCCRYGLRVLCSAIFLLIVCVSEQILLSSDDVSYKIRPIAGYADLMDANELLVKGSTVLELPLVCSVCSGFIVVLAYCR